MQSELDKLERWDEFLRKLYARAFTEGAESTIEQWEGEASSGDYNKLNSGKPTMPHHDCLKEGSYQFVEDHRAELAAIQSVSEQQPVGDMGELVARLMRCDRDMREEWPDMRGHGHTLPSEAATAIEQLQSNVERLTRALEPFAREAERWNLSHECDKYSFAGTGLSRRDLREAREALSNTTQRGDS